MARAQVVVGEARKRTRRPPPDLQVRVNGVLITNYNDLPIDLGINVVTAVAPGFADWSGQVTAEEEAQRITLTIDLERDADTKVVVDPAEPEPPNPPVEPIDRPSRSNRGAYGAITLAMGGVALGGGLMFGYLARTAWADAKAICGNDRECTDDQFPKAESLREKASSRGTLATVMSIAGGVAVVVGITLYVTAPSSSKRVAVTPTVSGESAGVMVFGRF